MLRMDYIIRVLVREVLDAPETIKVTAIDIGHATEVDGKTLSEGILCFTHRTLKKYSQD